MSTEEIIAGNKAIAEFIGFNWQNQTKWIVDEDHESQREIEAPLLPDDLEYHSSWDWLMPVIKKIDSLNPSSNFKEFEEWWDLIDNSVTQNYEIKEAYPFVVQFLLWYSSK